MDPARQGADTGDPDFRVGCLPGCQSYCGDGVVDDDEDCDDGNNTDGDGCQATCLNPVCAGSTCPWMPPLIRRPDLYFHRMDGWLRFITPI